MSESEVKEDDNETEHNSTAAPNLTEKKKKHKKRKKRSGKHSGYHRSSEDNADVRMKMCHSIFVSDNLFIKRGIIVFFSLYVSMLNSLSVA